MHSLKLAVSASDAHSRNVFSGCTQRTKSAVVDPYLTLQRPICCSERLSSSTWFHFRGETCFGLSVQSSNACLV